MPEAAGWELADVTGYPLAAMAGWGVFCAALGFAVAWNSKPARVQERIVESEREALRVEFARRVESSRTSTVAVRATVRTRWLPTPQGTVVEREETTGEDRREDTRATEAQTLARVEYRERVVERERLVTREAPAWRVAASVGRQLSGNPGGFTYGAELSRAILGPLEVGLRIQSDRTAAVVAAWRW